MNKVKTKMGLMMSVTMSFCLSLTGMLSSGKFTLPGFVRNFLISFLISTVITTFFPIRELVLKCTDKLNLKPGTLKFRLIGTLISDLLLSPIMTFVMVYLAFREAVMHGASIPFGPMLLKAEIISFVAAYILLYIITPIYMKIAFKEER